MIRDPHQSPWIFERNGDLNPTWVAVVGLDALGGFVCLWAILHTQAVTALALILSYLGTMTTLHLLAALPISKAKILAQSQLPGTVMHDLTGIVTREYGGSTMGIDANIL